MLSHVFVGIFDFGRALAFYRPVLATLGGQCEGRPGLRPEYHADYYGAYFRDPDGNKLCVVSHGVA